MNAVLRELADELECPAGAGYVVSPDGRRVAVLEWPAYWPRPRAPTLLLHYGSFVYDATQRAIPRLLPRAGRLSVFDTGNGARLVELPGLVAGLPVWSGDGRWLAGLRFTADGDGHGVWVLDVESGVPGDCGTLRISCSLLGLHGGGAGLPSAAGGRSLWWVQGGKLLVARDAINRDAIDPRDDIAAEPESGVPRSDEDEYPYHHDLLAIAAAARVDLVLVDPASGNVTDTVLAGCVLADCAVHPNGGRVLLGVARQPSEVAAVLTDQVVGYEWYDFERPGPAQSTGGWPVGGLRWQPGSHNAVVGCEPQDGNVVFRTSVLGVPEGGGGVIVGSPVAGWIPLPAGGVLASLEPGGSAAAGSEAGGRLVVAGPGTPAAPIPLPEIAGTVESGSLPGRLWPRMVPTSGAADSAVVVAVEGAGLPGELLFAVGPDWRPHRLSGLPAAHREPGRVVFLGADAGLVQWRDATGSFLVRRARGQLAEELVVHHLRRTAPTLGERVSNAHVRESPAVLGGPLTSHSSYELSLPAGHDPAGFGAGTQPAVVVELRPLAGDGPLPNPASPGAGGSRPPLVRAHLAAGHAIGTLYVRLPSGNSVRFTQIRGRLTGAVRALRAALGASGRVDLGRLVLAGHSFGAACAAVTLANTTDLFRCAVLRAGAYNRTLTPRGFQDEHRSLWQARDVYDGFTLAYHARAIGCPVLILQGGADTNGVTDALQAWAFYDTILAAGGFARLVLLYNEGHAFTTQEGLLAATREELTWVARWTRTTPP